MTPISSLLVSVRSAAEAKAALAGGAHLIDVKEPARGPLGRAEQSAIADVIQAVGGRQPVSAAMGELTLGPVELPPAGVAYAKWGLADWATRSTWPDRLAELAAQLPIGCALVPAAYADANRAGSPPAEHVVRVACERRFAAVLIDTFIKDGQGLLNWIGMDTLAQLRGHCRTAGVKFAVAGSLALSDLDRLAPLEPDWFAVRGAACHQGNRHGPIDEQRVEALVNGLCSGFSRTRCAS